MTTTKRRILIEAILTMDDEDGMLASCNSAELARALSSEGTEVRSARVLPEPPAQPGDTVRILRNGSEKTGVVDYLDESGNSADVHVTDVGWFRPSEIEKVS